MQPWSASSPACTGDLDEHQGQVQADRWSRRNCPGIAVRHLASQRTCANPRREETDRDGIGGSRIFHRGGPAKRRNSRKDDPPGSAEASPSGPSGRPLRRRQLRVGTQHAFGTDHAPRAAAVGWEGHDELSGSYRESFSPRDDHGGPSTRGWLRVLHVAQARPEPQARSQDLLRQGIRSPGAG
jgi:hypothetical protein